MSVKARIIKLERSIPTGLEAKLRALTDEELVARIAELCGVTVEEARSWTPEECRRLQDEIRAELSEADASPVIPERRSSKSGRFKVPAETTGHSGKREG